MGALGYLLFENCRYALTADEAENPCPDRWIRVRTWPDVDRI